MEDNVSGGASWRLRGGFAFLELLVVVYILAVLATAVQLFAPDPDLSKTSVRFNASDFADV